MNLGNGDAQQKIVILGALSAIAEAAARQWAEQSAHLTLVGRDAARLDVVAADLRVRGATVKARTADLATCNPEEVFDQVVAGLDRVDTVLLSYGILGDQSRAETSLEEAQRIVATNFTSAASWCLAVANVLEVQGHGTLIVVGSVAGDRGRASNYVYGAAKGGLALLVGGIAHRLARSGASAVVVKPGFVDTPMTAHVMKKGLLWTKPETIGKAIVRIASRARPPGRAVVYAPFYWRWIMLAIRTAPTALFHKTRL